MTHNQNIQLSLSVPSADGHDYVKIEQQPWGEDVGRTSIAQGILAIGSMVLDVGLNIPLPNCGGLGGYETPVYVFPSRRDLNFDFHISHGKADVGPTSYPVREEIIQCSLQDSVDADYPIYDVISEQWLGNCYDDTGKVVTRPSFTRIGRKYFFKQKIHGSLRIKYKVYRKAWLVRATARLDSIENNFDTVVFCNWSGGLEYADVKAPAGFEENQGNCGNGLYGSGKWVSGYWDANGNWVPGYWQQGTGSGTTDVCTPDYGSTIPIAVKADRHTKIDFCSQQVMSDTVTESVKTGKENEDGGCSDGSSDGTFTTN